MRLPPGIATILYFLANFITKGVKPADIANETTIVIRAIVTEVI